MTEHYKFSQLIENFSELRQAEIAKKTAQLKAEMAFHEQRQAFQLSQAELASKAETYDDHWTKFAGVFKEDPDFAEIAEAIRAERQSTDDSEVDSSFYIVE